jgi:hypothetical protein
MCRQLIAMGMDIMLWRKGRFYPRMVGRAGMRMIHGVMMILLIVAFLVLAGM